MENSQNCDIMHIDVKLCRKESVTTRKEKRSKENYHESGKSKSV